MNKFTDNSRARYDWVWSIERTWEWFVVQRDGETERLNNLIGTLDSLVIVGELPDEHITDFIDATISVEFEVLDRYINALRDMMKHLVGKELTWMEQYDSNHPSMEGDLRDKLDLRVANNNSHAIYPYEGRVKAIRIGALFPQMIVSAQLEIAHTGLREGFILPHLFDLMSEVDIQN